MRDTNASTRKAQERTLPLARNWGEGWGQGDIQLVQGFPECTAEELGEALGRTVYAVQSVRQAIQEGRVTSDGRRRPLPAPAHRFTFAKGWRD